MNMPALEIELSYRACEEITRREAANFFYGIRLLPRDKRHAMSAVYAFARRVDDIGDGDGQVPVKLAALAAARASLATLSDQRPDTTDPVIVGLADAHTRFDLPLEALELLIDGVELDVRDTRYETFDDLVVYCREVAGSIGRLCLAIFTDGDGNGHATLADDLGVAMQLTNILRDVREDYGLGRVYLPAEDLRRFACAAPTELSAELILFEAGRAREWFDRGLGLVDVLDARSASCVLAMTGIYRHILERITCHPSEILERRISLPAWEKAWLAARSLAGARSAAGSRNLAGART
ncbi:MAG: phytoene/squalene synthase family protein [Solirubrobacteraceae bacterium]